MPETFANEKTQHFLPATCQELNDMLRFYNESGGKSPGLFVLFPQFIFIAAGLVAVILFYGNLSYSVLVAGSIFVALLLALWFKSKQSKQQLTHAGGLVYKVENGKKSYLLVTSSSNEKRWVIPKGHIEKKETPEFTAIREVIEEAGVLAMPQKTLGYMCFNKDGEDIRVKYFLMKYVQDVSPSKEARKLLWLPKEAAIKQLSFDAGRIFKKA